MKQTYLVYLDEFGHVGPFISRTDPRYNSSPVFGFGGIIMPADQVRSFASFFFKLKCRLLDFEIRRDGEQPFRWEKKGASLYTTKNVLKYRELRQATFRLLNKIHECGGYVIYTGIEKVAPLGEHAPNAMMFGVLRNIIRRLDDFCIQENAGFLLFLDHHDDKPLREAIVSVTQRIMYGHEKRITLLEAPTQVESHLYQVMQATDWICGLVGRLEAFKTGSADYTDWDWSEKYFGQRMRNVAVRSGVRKQVNLLTSTNNNEFEEGLNADGPLTDPDA